MDGKADRMASWYGDLKDHFPDEATLQRVIAEIEFAGVYATQFKHGTDGHNRLMIIAKLAEILDHAQTGMY